MARGGADSRIEVNRLQSGAAAAVRLPLAAPQRLQMEHMHAELTIDAAGTACPIPIVELAKGIRRVAIGAVVQLIASDPAVKRDLEAWCASTGHQLLSFAVDGGTYVAHVRKVAR